MIALTVVLYGAFCYARSETIKTESECVRAFTYDVISLTDTLRTAASMDHAILVARGIGNFPGNEDRMTESIDIWWIVHILETSRLVRHLMFLGLLISPIELFNPAEGYGIPADQWLFVEKIIFLSTSFGYNLHRIEPKLRRCDFSVV